MVRAILLDSTNKEIREVNLGSELSDIYNLLGEGVRCFDAVNLGGNVCMYIDDEGLLKEAYVDEDGTKHNMNGIKIRGLEQVFMGNGILVGTGSEGDTIDVPVSVSQVEDVVTFVEYDNPEDRPEAQMTFTILEL